MLNIFHMHDLELATVTAEIHIRAIFDDIEDELSGIQLRKH